MILFKDILTFLGLVYRDASLKTLSLVISLAADRDRKPKFLDKI